MTDETEPTEATIEATAGGPPDGYVPTVDLKFVGGQLLQRYECGHPGNESLWLPVPSG